MNTDRRKMSTEFIRAVRKTMPKSADTAVMAQAKSLYTNQKIEVVQMGKRVTIDNPHYMGANVATIGETMKGFPK